MERVRTYEERSVLKKKGKYSIGIDNTQDKKELAKEKKRLNNNLKRFIYKPKKKWRRKIEIGGEANE